MLVMNGLAPGQDTASKALAMSASQNEFIVPANIKWLSSFDIRFQNGNALKNEAVRKPT